MWPTELRPSDRMLPEGRFSQMRQGGGWVWPIEPQSPQRASARRPIFADAARGMLGVTLFAKCRAEKVIFWGCT